MFEGTWTDEMHETLRRLWDEGHTTAQIAATMGGGLTKNAIIGKARRLDLPMRKPGPSGTVIRKGPAEKKPTLAPSPIVFVAPQPIVVPQPEPEPEPAPEPVETVLEETPVPETPSVAPNPSPGRPVELWLLPPNGCRFPVDEVPDSRIRSPGGGVYAARHLFCGEPRRAGSCYCEEHHRRAYSYKKVVWTKAEIEARRRELRRIGRQQQIAAE